MAIDYHLSVEGTTVRAVTSGYDEELEEIQAYGQAVIDCCKAHACNKILADERDLVYRISTLDIYQLAKYYAEVLPKVIRAAIVCHPKYIADGAFWETAVVNRGLMVRVFTSLSEAEAWLGLDQADSTSP